MMRNLLCLAAVRIDPTDLQSAIARTQATERLAALQNQQEELNRKRFELELARERAEKAKKAQDVAKAQSKRVVRDRYDGEGQDASGQEDEGGEAGLPDGEDAETGPDDGPTETGGTLDVRV